MARHSHTWFAAFRRGIVCTTAAALAGCVFAVAAHAQSGGGSAPLDMKYIPAESLFAGWAKPGLLLQNPELNKLATMFEEASGMKKAVGAGLADIDDARISLMINPVKRDPNKPGLHSREWAMFSLRFKDAATVKNYTTTLLKGYEPIEPIGPHKAYSRFLNFYRPPGDDNAAKQPRERTQDEKDFASTYIMPDDRTIVLVERHAMLPYIPDLTGPAKDKAAWVDQFAKIAAQPAGGIVDLKKVQAMIKEQMGDRRPTGMEGMIFNSFATLWEQADYAVGTVNVSNGIQANAYAVSPNENAAKRVEGTVKGLLSIAQTSLPLLKEVTSRLDAADPAKPGEQLYAEIEKLLKSVTVKRETSIVSVNISVSNETAAKIAGLLAPLVKQAREEAMANVGRNNLRQIALAMHNYADAHKAFPAAVVIGPDGKTPHSWRVAILPFIEGDALYKEYNLNEPWDSANNKKVLAKMPAVFRNPNQDPTSTTSNYFALVNPKAIFSAEGAARGANFASITDGTSNTLLVVEAERDIPWTKPEDIPVAEGKARPVLGTKGAKSITAAWADGSVSRIDPKMDDEVFWSIITKSGDEVVDREKVEGEFGFRANVPPPGFGGSTKKQVEATRRPTPPANKKTE